MATHLLVFGLGVLMPARVPGQELKVLHSFNSTDGQNPYAGLVILSNTLYGTTVSGGGSNDGTVFAINTDGTGFTTLHSFSSATIDGTSPSAPLAVMGNIIYGTASGVFSMSIDGKAFDFLHPLLTFGGVILSSNVLYGTTISYDTFGRFNGSVFKMNIDGTGFVTIYSFAQADFSRAYGVYTNSDGAYPHASLVISGQTLYGTTRKGGPSGRGTIFKVNTDGSSFGLLHDGGAFGGLILTGDTLYGETGGLSGGDGSVFCLKTDGTGFRTLHVFAVGGLNSSGVYTNQEGASPLGELALAGNTLYGEAYYGGAFGFGALFKLNTDGTGFTTLYNFTGGNDGAWPQTTPLVHGNALYGTAGGGGSYGNGTVFSLSIAPELSLMPVGPDLLLTWPTNFEAYALQSTPGLASPVWTTNLPAPVVVNGQYTVTNPIPGHQRFFRLAR